MELSRQRHLILHHEEATRGLATCTTLILTEIQGLTIGIRTVLNTGITGVFGLWNKYAQLSLHIRDQWVNITLFNSPQLP